MNPRRPPLPAPAASSSTSTVLTPITTNPLPSTTGTRSGRRCSNCGREGHTDETCFQTGGAMEGQREEYLASRFPKVTHIAEVEESLLRLRTIGYIVDSRRFYLRCLLSIVIYC